MASELSPRNEQFIRESLVGGVFPSREALLDSAIVEKMAPRAGVR